MNSNILVVGSINMDLVIKIPRVPMAGENIFGRDFQTIPGGKGANQAVGVARLGCKPFLSGRIGRDYFGSILLKGLRNSGVDTTHVERDAEASTGLALILIDQKGENSTVIATGANSKFSRDSALKLRETIGTVDLVLLQLELPLDAVAEVIDMARALHKVVVLDAGPPCKRPRSSFFKVTVLTPNEAEAESLSARSIKDLKSAREASRYLVNKGPEAVVLKLGEKGSLLTTQNGEKYFPPYRVDVVDTTAAGDAFSAALSVGIVEGKSLEEAVAFANAAGALAVTKLGARPSIPTLAELETFLSKS